MWSGTNILVGRIANEEGNALLGIRRSRCEQQQVEKSRKHAWPRSMDCRSLPRANWARNGGWLLITELSRQ
jgi:hypothetical protein